jgi:hypothetical protein
MLRAYLLRDEGRKQARTHIHTPRNYQYSMAAANNDHFQIKAPRESAKKASFSHLSDKKSMAKQALATNGGKRV